VARVAPRRAGDPLRRPLDGTAVHVVLAIPRRTVVDEQHPEWVFSMAGEYEVELTVSNDAGSDTVVKTIVVEATENIWRRRLLWSG
jgi:hypothetical protein